MKATEIAQLEAKNIAFYQHNGEYGVLIRDTTAEEYGIDTAGLDSENEIYFLPLGKAPAALFDDPENCARVDSDVYGGTIPAGDTIVRAKCRNLENEQRLETRWEEVQFAKCDLAERMLNIATDLHCDWESYLTRIGKKTSNGEEARQEWEEAVKTYSCPGMDFAPMSYDQILERFRND